MGEKIRTLGNISLFDQCLEVELNHSSNGSSIKEIHLQNDRFRIEMNQNEFIELYSAISLAAKKLRAQKNIV